MGQVVNWFLLLIIFVFDPLAIALVVAANMAFAQLKGQKNNTEEYFRQRNKELDKVVMSVPEGMEFNKSYSIDDISEQDEKRMDVIGQNGNEGLHYEEEQKQNNKEDTRPRLINKAVKDHREDYYRKKN